MALGTGTSISALRRTGRVKESSMLSFVLAAGGFAGQVFTEDGSPAQAISRTASSAAISAGMGDMLAKKILDATGVEDAEFDYDQQYEDDTADTYQHDHLEAVEEPAVVRPLAGNGYVRQPAAAE